MITEFTPLLSTIGGVLIGLASVLYMAFYSKIAGMTGILGGVLPPVASDWKLRLAFLGGAIVTPAIFTLAGGTIPFAATVSLPILALSGFIVGVGVFFGSGCTSGHGVCGMARLSPRSIVATLIFMASTFLTVFVVRHVLEAGL